MHVEDQVEKELLSAEEETIQSWDKWALKYSQQFMDISLYHASYDAFLTHVASLQEEIKMKVSNGELVWDRNEFFEDKNCVLLDVGCGPGIIAQYLLETQHSHHSILTNNIGYIGVDAAPSMIELAKVRFPSAIWYIAKSRQLQDTFPTQNNTFSGILAGFLIPYLSITDAENLFCDCNSLLKEGGILYVSFVQSDAYTSEYKSNSKGERVLFHSFNDDLVVSRLLTANFSILEIIHVPFSRGNSDTIDEIHTIILARKL